MQFFWDFKNYTPGEALPDWNVEFVDQYDVTMTFVVTEEKTLKLEATATGSYTNAEVQITSLHPDLQSVVDVDMVQRFRFKSPNGRVSLFNGLILPNHTVRGWLGSDSCGIIGVMTYDIKDIPVLQPDTWYWLRTRFSGPILSLKYWKDGDPEPGWLIHINDPERLTDSGTIAFLCNVYGFTNATAYFEWNYLGVGINGAVAPMPEDYTQPPMEPAQFYWNFQNDIPGETPNDWEVVDSSKDVTVDCVVTENNTLKLTATGNESSSILNVIITSLLPELRFVVDVDAILRFKFSGSTNLATGILFLPYESMTAGQVGLFQNSPVVALDTPNVHDYAIGSIPIQPDTWYFARIKFDGPNLSIKYWASGESEPDWMLSIEDPERVHYPGSLAFFGDGQLDASTTATIEWDYIGIGINGAEAPMPQEEEPPANAVPIVSSDTINNQILEEGASFFISGNVVDTNSGDTVTVKYKINDGTEQVLLSSTSDGVTPIQFSKQLIYSNKRLFDGSTDIVGEDLAENVDHTLTIWAEDDKGGVSDPITVTFRVIWVRQTPPVLSVIEPQNNKTLKDEDSYTISGAVTDLNVDDVVTVKFKINGGAERIIASAVSDGTSPIIFSKQLVYSNKRLWDGTTDIIGSDLAENVDHTITIWAEDDKGGVSEQIIRTFRVIWPVIPPPEEPPVEDAPWMTLKQIRDDVRSLIIEPSPGFRTDEEINLWINQAHQELGMLYGLERFTSIILVPGQIFYDLPSDFIKLIGAWDHQGNSLEIAPISFGQRLSNLESNTKVMVLGKKVAIAPLPENTPYITLFYERKPKLLVNDTDVPEIPAPYHRLLVAYATMRALQKDEDFEGAAFYSQEYEAGKALIAGHKIQASKEIQMILDLVRHKILNPAEAAVMLNIPLKDKVWQRVEVEEKGMALLYAGAISKADLIKNTVFTDREKIQERLQHKLEDFARIPGWEEAET